MIGHDEVMRVIRRDRRDSPEPQISDAAIAAAFDTACGLVRHVREAASGGAFSFDREAFALLIHRKTPPSYVGDVLFLVFLAEIAGLAADLQEAFASITALRVELQAAHDKPGPARLHFRDGGA